MKSKKGNPILNACGFNPQNDKPIIKHFTDGKLKLDVSKMPSEQEFIKDHKEYSKNKSKVK